MKTTKILFILSLTLCAIPTSILSIPQAETFEDFQEGERKRLEKLSQRRAEEKITMKPFTKITGIATLNKLLFQDSDEARSAELNKLPREVKEYLIPVIDDRKQLLDIDQLDEAAMISDLDLLQKQIQANLAQ